MALRRPKQQRGPGLVAQSTSGSGPVVDGSVDLVTDGDGEVAGGAPRDAATGVSYPVATGRIGEHLVKLDAVSQAAVDDALEKQAVDGGRLGEILLTDGAITEEQLAEALAAQYGLRYVALEGAAVDPQAVVMVPEALAREFRCVPLSRSGGKVSIALADPARPGLFEDLSAQVSGTLEFVVGAASGVDAAIDRGFEASSAVSDAVRVYEARVSGRAQAPAATATEVDANAPIVQVVNTILTQAVRERASDVHIEPMGTRVRVRNRIDGALHEVMSLPQSMAQALVSRIKIMADMNIVERRRPQDGQIETEVDGNALDVRVSTTSTQYGEKAVLRVLDKARALYDLPTLGMPPSTEKLYADIIRSPYGMVVCAGPTGSGKTTTLYASLMAINSDEINVMTVEDPVEYTFPTINQISIHEQAGVTFSAGLRAILRQDPDAILVGEIRDVETARIAIQAALTGHFVLSTIHATDATSALHRFLDMGIESFLLASSMLAVVGQRLVRRICDECAAPYEPSAEDLAFYERAGGDPKETFVKGYGCARCSDTGYLGRIGVYEVLQVTDEMRDLVVRNAPVDEIRSLAVEQGMVPLREQGLRLVAEDTTTIAEVMRTIYVL